MLEIEHSTISPNQGLRLSDSCSLDKHLRTDDEVRYHDYLTLRTPIARRGGGS
jgi:hypothetical protein